MAGEHWYQRFEVHDLANLRNGVAAVAHMGRARDVYTSWHQDGVAELSVAIAAELDFPTMRLEVLKLAALVHDVGKIAVSADILAKPGLLHPAELEIVKEHSRIGAEILALLHAPCPIAEIVHQHHERLDGSGYPRGLANGEILAESRIIAVADVYEAMTTHRPYRPALPRDEALAELARGRGRQYDPIIVDVLTGIVATRGADLAGARLRA